MKRPGGHDSFWILLIDSNYTPDVRLTLKMEVDSLMDNYLTNVYSDEITPDWAEDHFTWMDELNLGAKFKSAVDRVRELLVDRGDDYTKKQIESALREWIERRVELSIEDATEYLTHDSVERNLFQSILSRQEKRSLSAPTIFHGMRAFSPVTLKEMVIFFASKSQGVLKTKLNKLLWYADFLHYRLFSTSISGATYIHLPYGPVPENYERYLTKLTLEKAITIRSKEFGGYSGEIVEPNREIQTQSLPPTAVAVLDAVHERFRNYSSKDISTASHGELGYRETGQGEPISYDYARLLKTNFPISSDPGS